MFALTCMPDCEVAGMYSLILTITANWYMHWEEEVPE